MSTETPGFCDASFPARLESVVEARRLVSEVTRSWKLDEIVRNDAALAVSEFVTNSVLHAGSEVRVRIYRLGAGVRVEVGDDDPHLPVVDAPRPEDLLLNRSMTGRGLALVAATSDRWGAEPRPGGGKAVWAEVGTSRRLPRPAPAPAYPPTPPGPRLCDGARARGVVSRTAITRGGRRVHMVGVPVALLMESARQLSDLQREMKVMAMDRSTPPEVERVVQAGRPWMTDIERWLASDRRVAERAAAQGHETVDFELVLPEDVVQRMDGIGTWLRRAASEVVRHQLLTLPPAKEVAEYRRWYRGEILAQMSGRAPQRCPLRASRFSVR